MIKEIVLVATIYAARYEGRPMAGGGLYHRSGMTVASNALPMHARVKICHKTCAEVLVTDRMSKLYNDHVDLSDTVAAAIGVVGKTKVRVEVLP